MTTDILIIGQGICGTFLSWYLYKAGVKVLVIDEPQPFTATKVASGVINPVTGRQVVTTWLAEDLLPFTRQVYNEIGHDIGAEVISQKNIIVFPPSQQMRDAYNKRINEANSYIGLLPAGEAEELSSFFSSYYGAAVINPVWLADLHPLLHRWRNILKHEGLLLEEAFMPERLRLQNNAVVYGNITAKKIIFCNGINTFQLQYWQNLPFVFNKGEALIADIPGLPQANIYKAGNSTIVPWYDGLWWVGSSYENTYNDALPTKTFRVKKEQELQMYLRQPFTIIDHVASLRPAVAVERRPFAGFHPYMPAIGILNGMGTKGCSLAPWFAKQITENLLYQKPIDALADVMRFKRILQPV